MKINVKRTTTSDDVKTTTDLSLGVPFEHVPAFLATTKMVGLLALLVLAAWLLLRHHA